MMRANPSPEKNPARSLTADEADRALRWMHRVHAEDELLHEITNQVRRRHRRRWTIATGVCALVMLGGVFWGVLQRDAVDAPFFARTAVVSLPQRQVLPDGSEVVMKEGAAISVNYSGTFRRVTLQRGEAHFQVTKNPARPFVVDAAGFEVRAVGTGFAVQIGPAVVDVVVTEGRIALDREKSAEAPVATLATVDAGHRVVVESPATANVMPRVDPISKAEMADRLFWRVAQLEFTRTPLPEAIALMNQHGGGPQKSTFVIMDPSLRDVTLSGFLRADNFEGFERLLEKNFHVKAEHRGNQILLRKVRE
jgi:transmembrane sensor